MRSKNFVLFHKDFNAREEIFSQNLLKLQLKPRPGATQKMLCSGKLFKATFKLKIIPFTNLNVSKLREFTQTIFLTKSINDFQGDALTVGTYMIYLGCLAFFPSVSSWLVAKWTFRPSFNKRTYIAQETLNSVADPDTNIYYGSEYEYWWIVWMV